MGAKAPQYPPDHQNPDKGGTPPAPPREAKKHFGLPSWINKETVRIVDINRDTGELASLHHSHGGMTINITLRFVDEAEGLYAAGLLCSFFNDGLQ